MPGGRVVGLDLSHQMLAVARERIEGLADGVELGGAVWLVTATVP